MQATSDLAFAPLISWWLIAAIMGLATLFLAIGLRRRARGSLLRFALIAFVGLYLSGPQRIIREQEPLSDRIIAVIDNSASMAIGARAAQRDEAIAALLEHASERGAELTIKQSPPGGLSDLNDSLGRALAETNPEQLAGVFLISDGRISELNAGIAAAIPQNSPVHGLITGDPGLRDRRIVVDSVPEFALVDKPVTIDLHIEEDNADQRRPVRVTLRENGTIIEQRQVLPGPSVSMTVIPERRGRLLLDVSVEAAEGEATLVNNREILELNAVRDRLRVLLISGEPHVGERVWRDTLKSDPAVDLIHFTILRLPTSQDPTPVDELSLIPFPTRRLFEQQLSEFDLVIFDRYTLRGVLQRRYLRNLLTYVEEGGAILASVGPEFANERSLYRTALAEILPAAPTGTVINEAFLPAVTEAGQRHPVTASLAEDEPEWGRWFRRIEARMLSGRSLLGAEGEPLLVLDRVGDGRIAQVLSDHVWMWARGIEGGGPYRELLRRLAHWLMKEPDLEEERLSATSSGLAVTIDKRSMVSEGGAVEIRALSPSPSGQIWSERLALEAVGPGLSRAQIDVPRNGIYEIDDGTRTTLVGVGGRNRQEFANLIPTGEAIRPVSEPHDGGIFMLNNGVPRLRSVGSRAAGHGNGWAGTRRRDAARVLSLQQFPLINDTLAMIIMMMLLGLAWWREAR